MRKRWSESDRQLLRELYATTRNEDIAELVGSTPGSVGKLAAKLGLRKSEEWLNESRSGAMKRKIKAGKFKGKLFEHAPFSYPIGTTRVLNGELERKVSMTADRNNQWQPVRKLVWIEANGPVPKDHIVVFKPGKHTVIEDEITPENLECISRAENMKRNGIQNLPPEIEKALRLKGTLTKVIRNMEKRNGQNDK